MITIFLHVPNKVFFQFCNAIEMVIIHKMI
jgi:hypothetical protein